MGSHFSSLASLVEEEIGLENSHLSGLELFHHTALTLG
jgi:hypothetical protein